MVAARSIISSYWWSDNKVHGWGGSWQAHSSHREPTIYFCLRLHPQNQPVSETIFNWCSHVKLHQHKHNELCSINFTILAGQQQFFPNNPSTYSPILSHAWWVKACLPHCSTIFFRQARCPCFRGKQHQEQSCSVLWIQYITILNYWIAWTDGGKISHLLWK